MASNRSSRRRSRPALSQVDDDAGPSSAPRHTLLTLPWEVLDLVMHNVNASSLAKLSATCKFFRQIDRVARLRLTEKVAKEEMERRCGVDAADRWRWV